MKEINNIWQFFENLNEYVYATDIETYEMVYMNRKTLEAYGLKSLDEIKGRKCYEILQKSSIPCGMCNNDKICEGFFEEWRHYNSIIDKYLTLKDTLVEDPQEHRKYRLEIGIDISEERIQDKALQKYNSMEALVNEGLRIALMASTPDEAIYAILEYFGKSLNGERTYIFEKNKKGGDDNTYEWVAEGVKPEKDNLQNLPPEICANWYHRFQKGKHIVFQNLEEIREIDPLQYENLKRQDIRALAVVPLYDDGKVIAFYGVDNPPPLSLEYTSNMLQITGHFLVSCIRRRNLMREDQLILRACDCMSKAFGDYGVFRIGGDELLALCSQIEQDVLEERIRLLRKLMEENTVNMAVGMIWQDEATTELDILLQESEKLMYADKAEYYRKNGIERRRR